jgi:response regulator RpfG family c-di-GMP phosphodiesterase
MKTHVNKGLEIIGRSQWLTDAVEVVGGHHEKICYG